MLPAKKFTSFLKTDTTPLLPSHLLCYCYQTKFRSTCPTQSAAHQLTLHCGEGNFSVYCRIPNEEKGQLMLKRSELLTGFLARIFFFFLVLLHMACGNSLTTEKTTHPAVQSLLTTEPPGKPRQRFVKATLKLRVIGCLLSWWTFFYLLGGKVIRWCLGNLNHQHLWF